MPQRRQFFSVLRSRSPYIEKSMKSLCDHRVYDVDAFFNNRRPVGSQIRDAVAHYGFTPIPVRVRRSVSSYSSRPSNVERTLPMNCLKATFDSLPVRLSVTSPLDIDYGVGLPKACASRTQSGSESFDAMGNRMPEGQMHSGPPASSTLVSIGENEFKQLEPIVYIYCNPVSSPVLSYGFAFSW
jgi:hypothetical protein